MSNCSERRALLAVMAKECALLSGEIAALGAAVSAGTAADPATIVVLQGFDSLAQQAQAYGRLLRLLAQDDDPAHGFSALAGQIPLPAVRRRLLAALCLPPAEESAADNEMWG